MRFKALIYALPLFIALALPGIAGAQITVQVTLAPPELPVYDQPPLPADGYLWTPGYWAWDDDGQDYYWVPGTWVTAPEPGFLWTPGYWGFAGGVFLWHAGYWGPHIGFYGGVNYGYGYTGVGYQGGYWQNGRVYYNRNVVNVSNTQVTNVYNKTVINNVTVNHVSYNGGSGGLTSRPSAAEEQAAHDRHVEATPAQHEHIQAARSDASLRAAQNHGKPPVAATAKPGNFSGAGVVAARMAGNLHSEHVAEPRRPAAPATPQKSPTPREAPQAHEAPHPAPHPDVHTPPPTPRAAEVEPRREPAHTAPKPRPEPRPDHPPEHPQDHEHH
jgi:hypothetical protein